MTNVESIDLKVDEVTTSASLSIELCPKSKLSNFGHVHRKMDQHLRYQGHVIVSASPTTARTTSPPANQMPRNAPAQCVMKPCKSHREKAHMGHGAKFWLPLA